MIRNNASVGEQQNETSLSKTEPLSSQNQISIPDDNIRVTRISRSSGSDDWSSSDEDDGKQVAEIRPEAPTKNGVNIVNRYSNCTNVNSTVHHTNVYKDGVTVVHNIYCCPPSPLDYVAKWCRADSRAIIIGMSGLTICLIIFFGLWLPIFKASESKQSDNGTETTSIMSTTGKMSSSTTIKIPSSTDVTSTSITLSTSTDLSISNSTENPNDWKIIKRKDWGAALPKSPPNPLKRRPPIFVVFSETKTRTCTTRHECMEAVRNIQTSQMNRDLDDIEYNFLIAGDGMVYEGRGWDVQSGIQDYDNEDFMDKTIVVSFIGKFDTDVPTEIILQVAKTFLTFGSQNHKLLERLKFVCLRDMTHANWNPGDNLYNVIQMWDGYRSSRREMDLGQE